MSDAIETYEATTNTVRRLAAEGFSQHILEQIGEGEWWCHRPNSGYHSFRVIVRTGMVLVYGDVGHGIFRGGEAEGNPGGTLGWLREAAVDHQEYLMGKLRPKPDHFYPDDALDYARQCVGEGSARWVPVLKEAERLRTNGELDARTWGDLVYGHTHDPDACMVGHNYPADALWLVEALRWLVEHLPAEREPSGA